MCRDAINIVSRLLLGQRFGIFWSRRVVRKTESWTANPWIERAMEANYDEDLSENPFLRVLRCEYAALFERAVNDGWIVCVPRSGSFAKSALVEDDFLAHILTPEGETSVARFRTLSGKEVKVSNRVLTIDYDIAKPCSAHLLFEETFYTDDRSKYSLWCIERPLEQSISASRDDVLASVTNLRETLDLLWTEVLNKEIIKEMTMAIEEFEESHDNLDEEPLHTQRDLVGALYARNLRMLLQDVRLREKTESNRHFLQNIKVAAETYTLHGLRNLLPRSVSARTAHEDAKLNKTIKNLHDLQLRDLVVRSDIYDGILRGKLELSRIDGYPTVLGKIGCLKKAIRYITEGVTLVSSDDILPVLIFLVVRAGLPNWTAQLALMKQFRFSINSTNESDEAGFLITSLEAAVEHVRSGVLRAESSREIAEVDSSSRNSTFVDRRDVSLSNLFSSVIKSDLPEVKRILDSKITSSSSETFELCHPLCSCDNCEKRIAAVGGSISESPTVHSRDDRGMTAIHVASLSGNVTIVDYLLEHGANSNDSDADGTTPLHCAASRGHQNTLLLLLHANASPTTSDSRGNTALHLAADHGHEGCVKALLYFTEQMGIRLSKSPVNFNGETPLHHAAKWGYDGIVEILMEHGADPRATNRRGQTPLVLAHSSRVSKLLENITNGYPPKIFQRCTPRSASLTSGESSIKSSRVESRAESKNATRKSRKAARLMAAIAENDVRLACYYLGLEGPPKSPVGEIPSLCHPLCNCERCCGSSEESAAPATHERERAPSLGLNACNEKRETALHVASFHGRTELVQILLDAGANVNSTTNQARTPLHLACTSGSVKIVKLLLNCGNCDINATDAFGDTPLHLVARNGNPRIVQLLTRYGANASIRNSRGAIPLEEVEKIASSDIFVNQSLSSIVKILKNTRDLDNCNEEKVTPDE